MRAFVLETRTSRTSYRRRRACVDVDHCGHRFSTVEQVVGTVAHLVTTLLDESAVANLPANHSSLEPDIAAAIIATEKRRAIIHNEQRTQYDDEQDFTDRRERYEAQRALRGY
jgi:hypothetical protein